MRNELQGAGFKAKWDHQLRPRKEESYRLRKRNGWGEGHQLAILSILDDPEVQIHVQ